MLQTILAGVASLGMNLDADSPFLESGLDSLAATQLRALLTQQFPGLDIPVTAMFDYPTPTALAAFVAEQAQGAAGAAENGPGPRREYVLPSDAGADAGSAAPLGPDAGAAAVAATTHPAPGPAEEVLEVVLEVVTGLAGSRPEADEPMMTAGLDSLGAVQLRSSLSERFGLDLPATLALDYPSALGLARYISQRIGAPAAGAGAAQAQALGPGDALSFDWRGPDAGPGTSAVLGLSSFFPGSEERGLQGLAEQLIAGKDLVRTVPRARWDIDAYYSPDISGAMGAWWRGGCWDMGRALNLFPHDSCRRACSFLSTLE